MIDNILKSRSFEKRGGSRLEYYEYVLTQENIIDGLWLEFGVYRGATIEILSKFSPGIVYGFDSFEGLPEDWVDKYSRGHFRIRHKLDNIARIEKNEKIKIVTGWFSDILPGFLKRHQEICAVVHIDSDLYSSARDVLINLESRIVPGTLILFDEIHHYKGYEEHEYKAFSEFLSRTGYGCNWIAHVRNAPQAACFIL